MRPAPLQFVYPIAKTPPHITSDYKERWSVQTPGKRVFHDALDLRAASGTGLLAPADGKVTFSGEGQICGGQLTIEHHFVNGQAQIRTYYCHLRERHVKAGDRVKQGQRIGLTGGNAGDPGAGNSKHAHLHFVVQRRDAAGSWKHTDPKPFMKYALKGLPLPAAGRGLLISSAAVGGLVVIGALLFRRGWIPRPGWVP